MLNLSRRLICRQLPKWKACSSTVANTIDPVSLLEPSTVDAPVRERKVDEFGRAYGTGRRKTSVARVWVKEGSGQFVVNDKPLTEFFQPSQREALLEAFLISKTAGLYDVFCTVKGGGMSGQAGAVRLGISRALDRFDPSLHTTLAQGIYLISLTYNVWTNMLFLFSAGLLSRDARKVERKKPGQKKARKKFQWVKR